MANVLILYASTDGHTKRICERLASQIADGTASVTLAPIEQAAIFDLPRFDKAVIGASIRYGRHSARMHAFVDANAAALNALPSAFFSVNLTARKPGKNRPDTNPYVHKVLAGTAWRPRVVDVFAGRLDYPRYGWLDRQIIRFIMLITQGPTDPRTVVDYTDWERVRAFAARVAGL